MKLPIKSLTLCEGSACYRVAVQRALPLEQYLANPQPLHFLEPTRGHMMQVLSSVVDAMLFRGWDDDRVGSRTPPLKNIILIPTHFR